MRPQANRPAGPISAKYLPRVLRDRYYLGFVSYKGEEYQGRHEPLVSAPLFAKVQAVLDERLPKAGERQRRHHHYLKGSLWCGRCHDKGVESRLVLTRAKGNGGEYWYFFCVAREELETTLADEERSFRLVHENNTKRLAELDIKEENLLDLVEAGGAVATK